MHSFRTNGCSHLLQSGIKGLCRHCSGAASPLHAHSDAGETDALGGAGALAPPHEQATADDWHLVVLCQQHLKAVGEGQLKMRSVEDATGMVLVTTHLFVLELLELREGGEGGGGRRKIYRGTLGGGERCWGVSASVVGTPGW